jgi:ABC-type sulfate transport system substrate-binding protein
MKEFVDALVPLTKAWHDLVSQILQRAMKNPDDAGAASYDFLSYSGYVIYAYLC